MEYVKSPIAQLNETPRQPNMPPRPQNQCNVTLSSQLIRHINNGQRTLSQPKSPDVTLRTDPHCTLAT